jgi:hypothetical protein
MVKITTQSFTVIFLKCVASFGKLAEQTVIYCTPTTALQAMPEQPKRN